MATTVDIRDEVTPILQGLGLLAQSVRPAIGAAVVELFQQNFRSLPDNKQGWPTTNFWARAARSTNYDVAAEAININVDQQGVRQRLEGGEIRPVNKAWLTIPARAEAYGKRAGEFSGLHFVFFRQGHAALMENDSVDVSFGKQRKDGSRQVKQGAERSGVMFWLVKSVTQTANPAVIPSEQSITATAMETATGIAERFHQRGGAS